MKTDNKSALTDEQIAELVNRFLAWPLPKTVCADVCATNSSYEFPRSGTNLLSSEEAESMIRHLLGGLAAQPAQAVGEDRSRYLLERLEPLLEAVALGKQCTIAAGDLLRQVRNHLGIIAPDPVDVASIPIPMILHCPSCGHQHIDAPEDHEIDKGSHVDVMVDWANPPHRSHLCHECGTIWRPADVPTTGVEKIKTTGKNDSAAPDPILAAQPAQATELHALRQKGVDEQIARIRQQGKREHGWKGDPDIAPVPAAPAQAVEAVAWRRRTRTGYVLLNANPFQPDAEPLGVIAPVPAEKNMGGTFACPICGKDTPHPHSSSEVAAYHVQCKDQKWSIGDAQYDGGRFNGRTFYPVLNARGKHIALLLEDDAKNVIAAHNSAFRGLTK